METIYGLSIYVSFKLQTYYHSITRQTKRRNFENLVFNKYQTRKYFFRELKLFSGFSSQLIPHSQDPFLFLRNTGPIIDFIQGLLLLWRAHHKNYPHTHPYIIGKFWFSEKVLFALSKITNNCLGEKRKMGCRPFYFIFKNVLFLICCTE